MEPSLDLTGRVVVVTGANSGIGKETAVALAKRGARVALTSRDRRKGERALAEVRKRAPEGEADLGILDLASFNSVRAYAAEVLEQYDRLDVLVNNAGLMLDRRVLTDEGFEMTFGVNHLGHFLLTDLLRERLVATAAAHGEARVVNVSSVAHRSASASTLLSDPNSERSFTMMGAYGRSKLANILFTNELARRLERTGVTANSLHPGMIRSGFASDGDTNGLFAVLNRVFRVVELSPYRGAKTTVKLAASPALRGVSGQYFSPGRSSRPSADGRDPRAAGELWQLSERMVAAATPS